MRPTALAFTFALLAALVGALYIVGQPRSPWVPVGVLASAIPEPSGIVFHPSRRTLFVVGDEGDVAEIETAGHLVRRNRLAGADFEGITVDPATGRLYALIEAENRILEIEARDLRVVRRFAIDGRYRGQTLLPTGAEGLEGIAFVPNRDHPEGGRFFVVNRGPVPRNEQIEPGGSFVAELAIALKSASHADGHAQIVGAFPCDIGDLSDLAWSGQSGLLVAISDQFNCCIAITPGRKGQHRIPLPGRRQEGIAFDDRGNVYVAQDSGGILRLRGGDLRAFQKR